MKTMKTPVLTVPAAILLLHAMPSTAGDPELGEFLFRVQLCAACHVLDRAENLDGPHLVGIFGRKAGAVEDFNYSDAMRGADFTWNEERVEALIANPQGFLPGNTMNYMGLRDAENRAHIIAYLKAATRIE